MILKYFKVILMSINICALVLLNLLNSLPHIYGGPQGFFGSGENGYLFSGGWGALVIILGELGSKLIIWENIGSLAKKQKTIRKSLNFD